MAATAGDAWSIHVQILPYIEQTNLYHQVNFGIPANQQDAVTRQRIPIYVCPSEVRDEMKVATSTTGAGAINRYPPTYGANVGTWMVWDPNTGSGGDGALPYTSRPNGGTTTGGYPDGLSNTVGFAEVKAYTWNRVSNAVLPSGTPPPASTAELIAQGGR